MKQITKLKLVVFCCASFFLTMNNATAQNVTPCGTTEMHLKAMETDPAYRRNYLEEQARLEAIDKKEFANGYKAAKSRSLNGAPKYIIPVVFHIIHQYGPENISDEQCKDAIRTLTEDFRKLNKDTINTVSAFKAIAADCEIEFRLAGLDPSGKPTNGIERIFSRLTNSGTDSAKLNPWPRDKYLNIWVVGYVRDGFAAFATYPGGPAEKDGILSLHTYIGAIGTSNLNQSHTLSHEAAHYLNIQHVWGNNNAPEKDCGDDQVSDTPLTKGHNNKCPLTEQVCTPGVIENVQNFMEYSYCYTMFTEGQKTRMHAALMSSVSSRNNLWTVNNLLVTGVTSAPVLGKADFKSSDGIYSVCQGGKITFKDASWNARPTSWNWEFEGGTPSTSTDSIPVVTYSTPGFYDVKLTVSDGKTTVSETKKDLIAAVSSTGIGSTFIRESFETDTIPNPTIQVAYNAPGNTWKRTNVAASNGTYSAMIVNTASSNTFYDDLVSQPIDMTKITGPNLVLAFSTAYAKRVSTSADIIEVFLSADCGKTWELRKLLGASKLTNGVIETGNYVPTGNQWIQQSLPITAPYNVSKNMLYKIRFTSNGGNNIYIDDILVTGSLGIKEELADKIILNIYPNPMQENSVVSFDLQNKEHVTIAVRDVLGRVLLNVFDGNLNPGNHAYSIWENSKLATGVYYVTVTIGDQAVTRKFIANE
jgi:PKD repeat protein